MNQWNPESVTEACIALDAAKIAEGNMRPLSTRDFRAASKDNPEVPSWVTVNHYIGGMDDLQRVLGRVTTAIALEWTEQQWTDNAQWANDVLAAKGVDTMTSPHIAKLASAGLMPNTGVIDDVWGSIPEYRVATGIEKQPLHVEAKSWDKPKFFQNGREFADYLGREIGFPVMPNQDDLYMGSVEGLTPAYGQIMKACESLEQYQAGIGFVNSYVIENWSDKQWRENFEWLSDVFREQGEEVTSIRTLLEIAGRLHIGPTVDAAVSHWGSLTDYAKYVGFETDQIKRQMSDEGTMRAAIELVVSKKKGIRTSDLDDHPQLGEDMLKHRFGSLPKLNLRLGIITSTHGWDKDMLLWWGVTNWWPTAGRAPRTSELEAWSGDDRGPSQTKVYRLYRDAEQPMQAFGEELEQADRWMANQINRLARANSNDGLSKALVRLAITRNPALFHPRSNIGPSEIDIFNRLNEAGVNLQLITHLMNTGISFTDPEPQLATLANTLAEGGALTSRTLKRLEPYIIGLAPPRADMNWNNFIVEHRDSNRKAA